MDARNNIETEFQLDSTDDISLSQVVDLIDTEMQMSEVNIHNFFKEFDQITESFAHGDVFASDVSDFDMMDLDFWLAVPTEDELKHTEPLKLDQKYVIFNEKNENNNVSSRFVDVNDREIDELIRGVEKQKTRQNQQKKPFTADGLCINTKQADPLTHR